MKEGRIPVTPYRQEEPWSCLAACVRMALAFLGRELSEPEIRRACGTSPLGTSIEQAATGLERLGFAVMCTSRSPQLQALFDALSNGLPVICSQMAGVSRGSAVRHAVLVSGADDELVYFVDPHLGVESSLPISSFYNSWLLSGGDMLVVEDVL